MKAGRAETPGRPTPSVYINKQLTAMPLCFQNYRMTDHQLVKMAWSLLNDEEYPTTHPVKVLARGILVHINPDHFARQFGVPLGEFTLKPVDQEERPTRPSFYSKG